MNKEDFIFDVLVVDPIKDILKKLEAGEFRDSDIPWLNNKLEKYTDLALQTMGESIPHKDPIEGTMNQFNTDRFKKYFNTLLEFFNSLD